MFLGLPKGSIIEYGYSVWLCPRKWLILFSLKLQRDNRQNALSVDPPRGKPEKKAVFSSHCGDETTTNYNRAFCIHNTVIIPHCYIIIPLRSSKLRYFVDSLFRKKRKYHHLASMEQPSILKALP